MQVLWHKHPKRNSHTLQVFTVCCVVEHYYYNFDYRKLAHLVAMKTPGSNEENKTEEGVNLSMVSIVLL